MSDVHDRPLAKGTGALGASGNFGYFATPRVPVLSPKATAFLAGFVRRERDFVLETEPQFAIAEPFRPHSHAQLGGNAHWKVANFQANWAQSMSIGKAALDDFLAFLLEPPSSLTSLASLETDMSSSSSSSAHSTSPSSASAAAAAAAAHAPALDAFGDGAGAGALDAGALDAGVLDAGALDAGALDAGALASAALDASAATSAETSIDNIAPAPSACARARPRRARPGRRRPRRAWPASPRAAWTP